MRKVHLLLLAGVLGLQAAGPVLKAQSPQVYVAPHVDRTKEQLSGAWKFIASDTLVGAEAVGFDDRAWATVSVPHTWDTVDAVTKHSNSWYRTHFTVAAPASTRAYVYFEGVFQVADVFVNGVRLGQHRGGYTRFIFDASTAVVAGDNVLAVKVSNADCADCLPNGNARLWKGYGGIYRKAWILKTNPIHVSPTDFASSGVYITPSTVSSQSAAVSIKTLVTNATGAAQTITVKNFVTDATENVVLALERSVVVPARSVGSVVQSGVVLNPRLWSPQSRALYNVHAEAWTDGVAKDLVNEHTGFRSYQLTTSDFVLNGLSTRLRGVSKHQETEYRATAVADADLVLDWTNLQDLGVNFVRLPHYPHAELEYDLADQLGIMVWAENGNTNSGAQTPNGDTINREMVFQNWNHPSIIFWSAGNEASNTAADSGYAAVLQATDSSRPIVYASNGQNPTNVDFIFRNTYEGWYSGTMYDFMTSNNHFISESGAGMVIGTHTADAFAMKHTVDSFEPEEYGALDNEVKFQTLFVTDPSRLPAFSNWVFRDFGDNKYKGHINTKGFLTFSNFKKDIYFLYQSFLRTDPVINIAGAHYFLRSANPRGQGDIKVYSNAPSVTLTVNGASRGTRLNGSYAHPNGTVINNVFYWTNALRLGRNLLTANDGRGHTHSATVYYKGTGQSMPLETGIKVANLASSNAANPAFFINKPLFSQRPFYWDFDGTADNTFDVIPAEISAARWIATKRQSDPAKTTNLTFDLTAAADVYIMFTRQASTPTWIVSAGFSDTGVRGQWRNNAMKLVDYRLFKRSFAAPAHVSLGSSAIDFVVLIK
jgi:beta-galactosidase